MKITNHKKRLYLLFFIVITCLCIGCLAGCGNASEPSEPSKPSEPSEQPPYTVTFQNWNGRVISTAHYHAGDTVTAPADPQRLADITYTYTFAGWDKDITVCTGDATYTATYTRDYIDYTVTFQDWDGTVLLSDTYHYMEKITAPPKPSRPETHKYIYAFAGWDKPVTDCYGNMTYTARYEEEEKPTLQVWAVVGPEYEGVDNIQVESWLWMVRAAMEEWAALNQANLIFVSNYDQMSFLAAICSSAKPDFVFTIGKHPELAQLGMVKAFTEEQSAKITEVVGDSWFLTYRGKNVGVAAPWAETKMVYYNETMMKNLGVKTPMEYIKEGNWTWENYLEICRQCTKDLNSDGKTDIWGSTTYSVGGGWSEAFTVDPDTGRLINNMDSKAVKDWLDVYYEAVAGKNPCLLNAEKYATDPDSGIAMSIASGELYNFDHTYQTLSNGYTIRAVPLPTRYADDEVVFRPSVCQFAIPLTANQSDAAVDMLCYILKAGLKWMEDHSEGIFETEYEGIVGACDYSAGWYDKYSAYLENRHTQYEDIKELVDVPFYEDIFAQFETGKQIFAGSFSGIVLPWFGEGNFSSIFTEPPETSLPKLRDAMESLIHKYNYLYIL